MEPSRPNPVKVTFMESKRWPRDVSSLSDEGKECADRGLMKLETHLASKQLVPGVTRLVGIECYELKCSKDIRIIWTYGPHHHRNTPHVLLLRVGPHDKVYRGLPRRRKKK